MRVIVGDGSLAALRSIASQLPPLWHVPRHRVSCHHLGYSLGVVKLTDQSVLKGKGYLEGLKVCPN